jgi:hypothetical protein
MVDPVTAWASAQAAYKGLQSGFAAGKELVDMASTLGKWMSCLSDIEQAEKEARNPPIFKKLFGGKSVEQEALETFAIKRKAEEQRKELKNWICWTLGQNAWNELIQMEVKIRKERKETLYRQRERRKHFAEIVVVGLATIVGAIMVIGIIILASKGAQ